ncbi:MAG: peptidase M14 family protein [Chloroflexi bacterium]|nr:peptidase M14 family protein [Chloroflexota bacterium]
MTAAIALPEQFFGFPMGADRKLARWDRIYQYFRLLDEQSDRVETIDLGQTTEGHPFILCVISSAANLAQKNNFKQIARRLARDKDLPSAEARALASAGKVIVVISCSIHSNEPVGTQMATALAYELATSNAVETKQILQEVILLLFPCMNPDGQITAVDWYNRWLGTEYEGCPLPWLYHEYTGHDNNRDSYLLTQKESQLFGRVLYREWYPQIHIDVHQMGSYGARMYVPPWIDPLHPNIDPLIWREGQLLGAHIAADLEANGITGVENATSFAGWNMGGWCKYAGYLHQIAGTFETASAQFASPIFIHPDQLQSSNTPRGRISGTDPQMIFPHPWSGGWWGLSDMVKQNLVGARAVLDFAAKYRETILFNMHIKAQRSVAVGRREPPFAYILPEKQHDGLTAIKLLQILAQSEVEIQQADEPFHVGFAEYPKGTYVLFCAQPLRPVIKTFFEKTVYPDNEFTRDREGRPAPGQLDLATWTLGEFMGVDVVQEDQPFQGAFHPVCEIPIPQGRINSRSKVGYLLSAHHNDSFSAVNQILSSNLSVERMEEPVRVNSRLFSAGTFFIPNQPGIETKLSAIVQELGLEAMGCDDALTAKRTATHSARVGVYQGYNGGNMDEGWCRWLLEQFHFSYQTVRDATVQAGALAKTLDVIVFNDDSDANITGLGENDNKSEMRRGMPSVPQEYRSGIGEPGIREITTFVEQGGTLIAIGSACDFAIKRLRLPIKNVVEGLKTDEYWCPGSTLRVQTDPNHRLGYGMPARGFILGVNQPVLQIQANEASQRYCVVTRYAGRDILQSGRLVGESRLRSKPALIEALYGKGRVLLYTFRPHFRAHTHASFKFLFNALVRYEDAA